MVKRLKRKWIVILFELVQYLQHLGVNSKTLNVNTWLTIHEHRNTTHEQRLCVCVYLCGLIKLTEIEQKTKFKSCKTLI